VLLEGGGVGCVFLGLVFWFGVLWFGFGVGGWGFGVCWVAGVGGLCWAGEVRFFGFIGLGGRLGGVFFLGFDW